MVSMLGSVLETASIALPTAYSLGKDAIDHKRSNYLHQEQIAQALQIHEREAKAAQAYHRAEIQQANNQHAVELTQSQLLHLESADLEKRSAMRENIRDEWQQLTEKTETMVVVNTLMLGVSFAMMIEGNLPDPVQVNLPAVSVAYYSLVSIVMANMAFSVYYSIALRRNLGKIIVDEMRTVIQDGRRADREFHTSADYLRLNYPHRAVPASEDITLANDVMPLQREDIERHKSSNIPAFVGPDGGIKNNDDAALAEPREAGFHLSTNLPSLNPWRGLRCRQRAKNASIECTLADVQVVMPDDEIDDQQNNSGSSIEPDGEPAADQSNYGIQAERSSQWSAGSLTLENALSTLKRELEGWEEAEKMFLENLNARRASECQPFSIAIERTFQCGVMVLMLAACIYVCALNTVGAWPDQLDSFRTSQRLAGVVFVVNFMLSLIIFLTSVAVNNICPTEGCEKISPNWVVVIAMALMMTNSVVCIISAISLEATRSEEVWSQIDHLELSALPVNWPPFFAPAHIAWNSECKCLLAASESINSVVRIPPADITGLPPGGTVLGARVADLRDVMAVQSMGDLLALACRPGTGLAYVEGGDRSVSFRTTTALGFSAVYTDRPSFTSGVLQEHLPPHGGVFSCYESRGNLETWFASRGAPILYGVTFGAPSTASNLSSAWSMSHVKEWKFQAPSNCETSDGIPAQQELVDATVTHRLVVALVHMRACKAMELIATERATGSFVFRSRLPRDRHWVSVASNASFLVLLDEHGNLAQWRPHVAL